MSKDPKEFSKNYKLKKKKGVPKGVDSEKHERCIRQVKQKGHDKSSAYAICNASMTKSRGEFLENFKKSTYDFRDVKVSIDSNQQRDAEDTASPELLEYLKASIDSDLDKIPMEKGVLTVFKKEEGLYSGFFSDKDGQVVEKFDDMTIPILAKNLEIKNLYSAPMPVEAGPVEEEMEDIAEEAATEKVLQFLSHHNDVYHRGQEPGEPINSGKGSLRIRMGDIDIEIKKSMNDFINNYKKARKSSTQDVIKAIQAWRRNSVEGKIHKSDLDAAKALLKEWEKYCEDFYQTMHAMNVENE